MVNFFNFCFHKNCLFGEFNFNANIIWVRFGLDLYGYGSFGTNFKIKKTVTISKNQKLKIKRRRNVNKLKFSDFMLQNAINSA